MQFNINVLTIDVYFTLEKEICNNLEPVIDTSIFSFGTVIILIIFIFRILYCIDKIRLLKK